VRGLTVLAHLALDYPAHRQLIERVLASELSRLVTAAVEQERTRSHLGVDMLADGLVVLLGTVDLGAAAALDLPERLGIAGTKLAAQLLQSAVGHVRAQVVEGASEHSWAQLATSLNNLAVRLAAVGRRDEAVGPIEEAVAIRRALGEANPATSPTWPRR
jgi:triphosphoribosyl-dephospho-CoA synthetase